jgi:hypothetical protein
MTRNQQQALIECLRALDGGASVEACLARFPEAEPLSPYLALRERLLAVDVPEAPAAAYASGRQALLEQLAQPATPAASGFMARLRAAFADGWQSRLVRAAAAAAIVFALVGGGLGASAAAGVDRAHDVLSALHIVAPSSNEQQPASPTPGAATPSSNGGQKNAPGAVDEGRPTDDASSSGNGTGNDGSGEGHGPCDLKDGTPASPCTPAENEGSAAHTPSPNDGNASDHPTPSASQETPHNPSGDPGEGSHPEHGANITPPPVDDSSEGGSRGGTAERPASPLPTDEHGNP